MADLISRAAAIAEVEEWAEHGYDVIHWTGIKAMLEIQPAVDAVPVEWLEEKMLNSPKELSIAAWRVLNEWHPRNEQEEQEAAAHESNPG